MLIAIVVIFTVCWGPALIDDMLIALGILPRYNPGYLKPMRQVFDVLSYFNSCVNPIVYAFMSRHWRREFRQALCCRRAASCRCRRHARGSKTPTTNNQSSLESQAYNAHHASAATLQLTAIKRSSPSRDNDVTDATHDLN